MAKKSLGQNFLHDTTVLKNILEAGELQAGEHIVEVGPGEGFLTRALLERKVELTAVEIDRDLIPWLKLDFGKNPNFHLIEGDALQFTPPSGPYKLIANIPYYITSPLLSHFLLEQFLGGNPPTLLVVMVQREVAEKIVDKQKQSVLSLEIQAFGEPELVCIVKPESFKPRPAVDSAVLKIRPFQKPLIEGDLKHFLWLIRVSFAQKRKKLSNNLSGVLKLSNGETKALLESAHIKPDVRAEELSLKQWQSLLNKLNEPNELS